MHRADPPYTLVLGDMVIFIIISPAFEIADTRYYRAWVGVGKRERLSVLVIGYFITIWSF